ncbi:hypothetical protein BDV96DRAFT_495249 [Lophiotrema nucula]|uniref:DUF6594 domain-containing protein n=1 Tax=Lophiotrema nucula TaxID=690887 RepID=A0A6A5Z4G4_9PLEO|nr:hypothetical protein BDV96DRAFT_495249 [Lophiotrema nucula]
MDIEAGSGVRHYLTGYPSLAAFIASDRDQTSAIFKRFKRLGARNLLHLQSELAELEARQDELDDEARRSQDLFTKQCLRNWPEFCLAASSDERQRERKELAEAIKATLRDYREALFLEGFTSNLPTPSKRTLGAFQYRFFNRDQHKSYPTLGAHSAFMFNEADDLLSLHDNKDIDRLTTFVQEHLVCLFPSRKRNGKIAYASDRHIAQFVAILSTFNAAALLVGAIISLYSVTSPKKKLGIIAAFTTLFAANVGLLTNARRAELFAASAG